MAQLSHPGHRRVARSFVLFSVAPVLLAGCSDAALVVSAPTLHGQAATACADLMDALPEKMLDSPSRTVNAADSQARWGSPPLVLTCGVSVPEEIDDFASCSLMAGVQWYVPTGRTIEDPQATVTVHTLGTEPVVRVDVPAADRPRFDSVVAALGPALLKHLRVVDRCAG